MGYKKIIMEPLKVNIVNVVQLIADIDAQKEYEINVPIAHIPTELISQWFDDFYHPENKSYSDVFTDKELSVLEEFNDFFDQRVSQLPDTLLEMHNSFVWKEVVGKAQWVLAMLGWKDIVAKYDEK